MGPRLVAVIFNVWALCTTEIKYKFSQIVAPPYFALNRAFASINLGVSRSLVASSFLQLFPAVMLSPVAVVLPAVEALGFAPRGGLGGR